MACRTEDPAIKQAIAFLSTGFGIDQETLSWRNALGRLSMEIRDQEEE